MIATHGPTLVLPNREGVACYFILRRVPESQTIVDQWHTHGVTLFAPTGPFPFGMARWVSLDAKSSVNVTGDSTRTPLERLAAELARVGIVAEHLTGEEAWPA